MSNTVIDIADLSDSRELMEEKAPRSIQIFILIVLAIIITLLLWSFSGEIDEYVTVRGEIRPQSNPSVITSTGSGQIKAINFENGESVESGDTILELDVSLAQSQKEFFENSIGEYDKKIEYNEQLKNCIEEEKNTFSKLNQEIEYYNLYEKYVSDLESSIEAFYDSENTNNKSKEEAEITLQSIQKSIDDNITLISDYEKLLYAVENDLSYSSDNSLLKSMYDNYIQGIDKPSQLSDIETPSESLDTNNDTLKSAFIMEINQKIDTCKEENKSLETSKAKTQLNIESFSSSTTVEQIIDQCKLNMMVSIDSTISALKTSKTDLELQLIPIDETIKNSKIEAEISGQIIFYDDFVVGNNLQAGSKLFKIMPSDNTLKAILYIPSDKISEIKVGQKIEYTISSISTTEYGKASGIIKNISADSFVDESSGVAYYRAESTFNELSLSKKSGKAKILKTGMTFDAHIISESKRLIIWFLEKINMWSN